MFRPIAAITRFSSESMVVFLDIVVLLTDTYTYCLYTHNGDGSF